MNPHTRRRAFSLLELMASVAVLAILCVLVAQITGATSRLTSLSNRAVDASAQARQSFDRLGFDLTALINRRDAAFFAGNPADGQHFLLFLSSVATAGPADNRHLSRVAYRVAPHAGNDGRPCLQRAAQAFAWNAADFMGDSNPPPAGPADADYEVLSPGVLRVVIGFQLFPDNQPATLLDGSVIPNALGQIVWSPPVRSAAAADVDLNRVSALVVGLVVADLDSLSLLTPAQAAALAAKFDTPSAANQLPVAVWTPVVNKLPASPGALPPPVCRALRLYQYFYPVTPYGTPPEH